MTNIDKKLGPQVPLTCCNTHSNAPSPSPDKRNAAFLSTVSVIVPIRNEEKYIRKCLESLLSQSYPSQRYEVIVVDGRSSDQSLNIVQAMISSYPNLRLLDNPAAIAPAAMNIGIRVANGDIIIRADGHNFYPESYIENCVKYLNRTGADNVGGPWITVPAKDNFGARLVAAVLTNPFGVGDSNFRIGVKEGFVETVPFGAFRRELFDRIGMFNEKLVRNQDNELNARIRQSGGKIYQTPALTTEYHPVARFRDLLRQTFRQSQWHVFSVRENAFAMRPRHFAPAMLVIALIVLAGLAPANNSAFWALLSVVVAYLIAATLFSVLKARDLKASTLCALPLGFACFHLAYGLGTLAGLKYIFRAPSRQPIRTGQAVGDNG